ncbi:TPA: hypothetical protein ACVU43_003046 [Vibrio parahaemolyticus]
MAVFLISYDLNSPGQKHDKIDSALKAVGGIRIMESCWLIEEHLKPMHPMELRDALLKTLIDDNDILFVTRVHQFDFSSWNLTPEQDVWLNNPMLAW